MKRKLLITLTLAALAVLAGVVWIWQSGKAGSISHGEVPISMQSPASGETVERGGAQSEAASSQGGSVFVLDVAGASGGTATDAAPFQPASDQQGLDVSSHQGDIDWATAAQGMTFAFIRIGYRAYGTTGDILPDPCFVPNFNGARAAGLDLGVYFFSQAITVEEAVEEAQYVLDTLNGCPLELPIAFDFEYVSGVDGRLELAGLDIETSTDICQAFCDTVEAAGYTAMLYSNPQMLTWSLDESRLAERYALWFSHWTEQTDYTGDYDFWQYTSTGRVAGISGDVDLDVRCQVVPNQVQGLTVQGAASGQIQLSWDRQTGVWGYRVWRQESGGEWTLQQELSGAAATAWTDTACTSARRYTYRVTGVMFCQGRRMEGEPSGTASAIPGTADVHAFLSANLPQTKLHKKPGGASAT